MVHATCVPSQHATTFSATKSKGVDDKLQQQTIALQGTLP